MTENAEQFRDQPETCRNREKHGRTPSACPWCGYDPMSSTPENDAVPEDCAHNAAWIEEGDESGSSGWWRCATCGHAEQEVAGRG